MPDSNPPVRSPCPNDTKTIIANFLTGLALAAGRAAVIAAAKEAIRCLDTPQAVSAPRKPRTKKVSP